MSTSHEAFEAHYQRSAEDPASAEMLAVWEAAWKVAIDRAYDVVFDVPGSRVVKFDVQTAIRKLKDAAAISSSGEREGETRG